MNNVLKELENYFNEKDAKFSLEYLNLEKFTPFQRKVLETEFKTKKGTINTYKDLAKAAGSPKAYRSVGTALSKNPYPIIIPCHRTVKSDRTIGGFGGVSEVMIQGKKVVGDSPIIALDKTSQTKLV